MQDFQHIIARGLKELNQAIQAKTGGPFGAVIFNSATLEIISSAHNTVLINNDPTAHAEIEAIRIACHLHKTPHLQGFSLYATGEPCPMCHAAIYWARLDHCYYCTTYQDATAIGFNDSSYNESMQGNGKNIIPLTRLDDTTTKTTFLHYSGAQY